MKPTYDQIKQALQNKGYRFFEGHYNVNLVGIRNTSQKDSNLFNDLFCIAFQVNDTLVVHSFPCTTDPGLHYRRNPLNPRGTAILPLGNYPSLWKLGRHQGKYPALVQAKPVGVYRDNDRNDSLDMTGELDVGWHGINCHRATASGTSTQVDKWSAGCQVIANSENFNTLMYLANRSSQLYGNGFSYTLLEDTDIG